MAERIRRVEVDQDRILLEIARLALNDPRRAFDTNGALLPIQDWPDEVAAAVSTIKVNEIRDPDGNVVGETKEIKFWDKGKQLELAARHLGMLNDKLELSTPVSQLLRAARERIRNG
jgi:phage terminase small subunit